MYSANEYAAARQILNERREAAFLDAQMRREELFARIPRLREIESQFAKTGQDIAKAFLGGGDVQALVAKLRKDNENLQKERASLLQKAGVRSDYLEPHYVCTLCQDMGYVKNTPCTCFLQLLKKGASSHLPTANGGDSYCFDSFSLDYYAKDKNGDKPSPYKQMEQVLKKCKEYAKKFVPQHSDSLLFVGRTGLGKTHLSLAIAGVVVEKGYFVLYDSAQNIIDRAGREKFGRDDSGEDARYMEQVLGCDLLIIDDLGSEFQSQLAASVMYHIMNTRLMVGRPTIASTNLSSKEIDSRYSERLASRLICSYKSIVFSGEDVRSKMKEKQLGM